MTLRDWRDVSADTLAPVYAAELERWRTGLAWDLNASIDIIETGRRLGNVPGLVVCDAAGRAVGWTFYLLQGDVLQIGGLAGETGSAVRRLLDGVLAAPEVILARQVSCFVFPGSPAVASALTRRRFAVRRHLYLARDLPLGPAAIAVDGSVRAGRPLENVEIREWDELDSAPAVRLFEAAYAGVAGAESFAPHGRLDEWLHYLRGLLHSPACGRLMPAACVVAEDKVTRRIVGLTLCGAIDSDVAHTSQVVVDPSVRGRGLGADLIRRSCDAAHRQGCRRITLLVEEGNRTARELYRGLGFEENNAFVFGLRPVVNRRATVQPRRSTSAGLMSGGAMTLR
jgi:N-acetyltransferase